MVDAVEAGGEGILVFLIRVLGSDLDLVCTLVEGINIRQLIGVHKQLVVESKGLITEGGIDITIVKDIYQGEVAGSGMRGAKIPFAGIAKLQFVGRLIAEARIQLEEIDVEIVVDAIAAAFKRHGKSAGLTAAGEARTTARLVLANWSA